jgi:hypothetical protein
MPYSIALSREHEIARVVHRGALTVDSVERAISELEYRFSDSPLGGLIVDLRDVTRIANKGEYLLWLKDRGGVSPVARRVAIVANAAIADETAFMTLALKNRHVVVWTFVDNKEALRWLFRPPDGAGHANAQVNCD